MWFQQDGAPAHAARVTIEMPITTAFTNRLVSRFGDGPWTSQSTLGFHPSYVGVRLGWVRLGYN